MFFLFLPGENLTLGVCISGFFTFLPKTKRHANHGRPSVFSLLEKPGILGHGIGFLVSKIWNMFLTRSPSFQKALLNLWHGWIFLSIQKSILECVMSGPLRLFFQIMPLAPSCSSSSVCFRLKNTSADQSYVCCEKSFAFQTSCGECYGWFLLSFQKRTSDCAMSGLLRFPFRITAVRDHGCLLLSALFLRYQDA
jgi:hypothetical protein